MNDYDAGRPRWSFWLISAIVLIWNLLGVVNFFMQMDPEVLAMYRASERLLVEGRPLWGTVAFAIAVFGGALGGVLLLLRKSLAVPALLASLAGVVVVEIYTLFSGVDLGTGEILGVVVVPLAIAAAFAWYARRAGSKGWLA